MAGRTGWALAVLPSLLLAASLGALLVRLGLVGPLPWRALGNTVYIAGGSLLLAFPLALGGGLYLAWGPDGTLRRSLEVLSRLLSGVPSLLIGLFGLAVLVEGLGIGFSRLAGILSLALWNLPFLLLEAAGAWRNAPAALREQALAVGATEEQAAWGALWPAARGAMLRAAALAAGRTLGESSVLLLTAGQQVSGRYSLSAAQAGSPLSVALWYRLAQGQGGVGPTVLWLLALSLGVEMWIGKGESPLMSKRRLPGR